MRAFVIWLLQVTWAAAAVLALAGGYCLAGGQCTWPLLAQNASSAGIISIGLGALYLVFSTAGDGPSPRAARRPVSWAAVAARAPEDARNSNRRLRVFFTLAAAGAVALGFSALPQLIQLAQR